MHKITVFIEPTYEVFLNDGLFDDKSYQDPSMSLPMVRLRDYLNDLGVGVHTADYLRRGEYLSDENHYYSFGDTTKYADLENIPGIRLCGFLALEPPLVQPDMYDGLSSVVQSFESTYLYNIHGDGYVDNDIDKSKLCKLFFPQPYDDIVEPYWSNNNRIFKAVVIAGSHKPREGYPELYSLRIKIIHELSKKNAVDLYGRGWDRWWSRNSMWLPYWKNIKSLMSVYKGSCKSKLEVLSRYKFSICFENTQMSGLVTEKIFDCIYAGCVPIYFGAADVESYIPGGAFIDARKFKNFSVLWDYVSSLTDKEINEYREVGRVFVRSDIFKSYYNSLVNICSKSLQL